MKRDATYGKTLYKETCKFLTKEINFILNDKNQKRSFCVDL